MFDEVNRLSANGIDQFRIASFDGSTLLVIGGFDLAYYHDIELTFIQVEYIRCPVFFWAPSFRNVEHSGDGRKVEITTNDDSFEIIAMNIAVTIGKVYYYDRGAELKAGERIAAWLKRGNA